MARRLVSVMVPGEGGPRVGGSGTEVRFYDEEALTTLSTVYQRATGVGTQPNGAGAGACLRPNAGANSALLADRLAADAFVTVVDVTDFQVGDLVPVQDAVNTVYRVITIITPATKRLDLDSALGFAFLAAGTRVGNEDMKGHIWVYLDDVRDYHVQVKDIASGRLLPPVSIPTRVPTTTLAVQEEGVAVNSRQTINFRGARVKAVDDAPNARINVDVLGGGGNLLVNPGFDVWQRGAGAFTASLAYGADRWQILLAGTDTLSISREGVTKKANSLYSAVCTFVLGTGAGATRLRQRLVIVDGHHYLLGQPVSFRFPLRVSAAAAARAYIATDGAGGTTTYSGYHTGAAAFEDLDVINVTVPTDATYVEFGIAFAASCTAYADNAMATPGEAAEPYVGLVPSEEWERAQRYYESRAGLPANAFSFRGYVNAATYLVWVIFMATRKAVTPTITKGGTWSVINCGQPAVDVANNLEGRIYAIGSAAGMMEFFSDSADDTIVYEANP